MKRYPHPKYAGIEATKSGQVFSNGRLLKGAASGKGYIQVYIKAIDRLRQAHRIIYECVTGRKLPKYVRGDPDTIEINHKDGIKTNNAFKNLEAITHLENVKHGKEVLKKKQFFAKGSMCTMSKLSYKDVCRIIRMLNKGMQNKDIAERFDIDSAQISLIKNRKAYQPEWKRYEEEYGKQEPFKTKLSFKRFTRIVTRRERGETLKELSERYGLTAGTLSSMLNRKSHHPLWQQYDRA